MRSKRLKSSQWFLADSDELKGIFRYAALFAMLLIPRTVYGFKYFPVVDDWFLYYGTSVKADSAVNLASRPFAALIDRYILVPAVDHMIIVLVVQTLILSAAAAMIYKAFEGSGLSCGAFLILFIAMPPIGFEGLYWVSASSRIISSVFFIALSLYCETKYICGGKKVNLVLFIISGVFAVGFYEIMIPVYCVISVLPVVCKRKKVWLISVPILFSLISVLYYKLNGSDPSISDRVMFVETGGYAQHIADLFKDYRILFTDIQWQLLSESLSDGVRAFIANPLWSAAAVAAAAVFAFLANGTRGGNIICNAAAGVCIILAAVSVNVIMAYIRLPFRVAYPVCIGAAVIAELILCIIRPKIIYKALVFCTAVICMVSSAGQVSLYRYVSGNDVEFAREVMKNEKVFDGGYLTYIFNERKYSYNDRLCYWEYVKSAEESYASLTGAVRYLSGIGDINNIIPVHENDMLGVYDYNGADVNLLYIKEDGSIGECRAVKIEDNYNLESDENGFIGSLTYENGKYRYNEYKISS